VRKKTYYLFSSFSYPNKVKSQNGFPRPQSAEKSWQLKIDRAKDKSVTLTAAGSNYSIKRTIAPRENHLEVTDVITNTTDKIQPVFIRNMIRIKNDATVWLSGLKV
jgi:hypothetical protein